MALAGPSDGIRVSELAATDSAGRRRFWPETTAVSGRDSLGACIDAHGRLHGTRVSAPGLVTGQWCGSLGFGAGSSDCTLARSGEAGLPDGSLRVQTFDRSRDVTKTRRSALRSPAGSQRGLPSETGSG